MIKIIHIEKSLFKVWIKSERLSKRDMNREILKESFFKSNYIYVSFETIFPKTQVQWDERDCPSIAEDGANTLVFFHTGEKHVHREASEKSHTLFQVILGYITDLWSLGFSWRL